MKNKILYLFLFLLLAGNLPAQDRDYSNESTDYTSLTEAAQIAEEIVKTSGLHANFAIAEADVPNAVAVLQQGQRYILYNPRFLNKLTRITGTKWAAISVLAHEIGHHLYGKTGRDGIQRLATELESDEFSGYVLEKMGATLPEAQAAMNTLATTEASPTHPARDDRLVSIAKGWKRAGGTISAGDEGQSAATLARVDKEPAVPPVAAEVYFNASPEDEFYVTNKMNLVRVTESRVLTIGRVARSDSERYPYILYDDNGTRLFVHYSGTIINGNGKVVGKMKAMASTE